ncbi:MAG: hypothetical protein AABZ15_05000 [Nitrospirota bacterium]
MKITMNNTIAFATAVVLTLTFGLAYAGGELPDMNTNIKDTGTELFESFLKHEADIGKGAAAGGVRAEGVSRSDEITNDDMPVLFRGRKDIGAELYEAHLKVVADISKGSAAGGVRVREASWPDDVSPYGLPK